MCFFILFHKHGDSFIPWFENSRDFYFTLNIFNHKKPRGRKFDLPPSPCCFSTNAFLWEKGKPWLFVKIILSKPHPSWNFNEIPQIIQKIWRFSSAILTIFINVSYFLTFPCYKEINGVTIVQMTSVFFAFNKNRLFKNCIKLYQ